MQGSFILSSINSSMLSLETFLSINVHFTVEMKKKCQCHGTSSFVTKWMIVWAEI